MRLTTKIFIGFLFFVFSIVLFFLIYLRFVAKPVTYDYDLGKELTSIEIPKTKVIIIDDMQNQEKNFYILGKIDIRKDTTGGHQLKANKKLLLYLATTIKEDTLIIRFDHEKFLNDAENKDYISNRERLIFPLRNARIQLPTDSSLHLLSKSKNMDISAEDLELNELYISAKGSNIKLKNNRIETLTSRIEKSTHYRENEYRSENNIIGTYNLYLQNISEWDFNLTNCSITQLNVFGANNKNKYSISDKGIEELNWYPQPDSKPLNLQISDTISINLAKISSLK